MSKPSGDKPRTMTPADYEQWARKVIAEHGQPPRQLRDRIRAIAKAAAARPSP